MNLETENSFPQWLRCCDGPGIKRSFPPGHGALRTAESHRFGSVATRASWYRFPPMLENSSPARTESTSLVCGRLPHAIALYGINPDFPVSSMVADGRLGSLLCRQNVKGTVRQLHESEFCQSAVKFPPGRDRCRRSLDWRC